MAALTPLCHAIVHTSAAAVNRCQDGATPFHVACSSGSIPVCRWLLSVGCRVDKRAHNGDQGIHLAAWVRGRRVLVACACVSASCISCGGPRAHHVAVPSSSARLPPRSMAVTTVSSTWWQQQAPTSTRQRLACVALRCVLCFGAPILSGDSPGRTTRAYVRTDGLHGLASGSTPGQAVHVPGARDAGRRPHHAQHWQAVGAAWHDA